MNTFLNHIIDRHLNRVDLIRPTEKSIFEPDAIGLFPDIETENGLGLNNMDRGMDKNPGFEITDLKLAEHPVQKIYLTETDRETDVSVPGSLEKKRIDVEPVQLEMDLNGERKRKLDFPANTTFSEPGIENKNNDLIEAPLQLVYNSDRKIPNIEIVDQIKDRTTLNKSSLGFPNGHEFNWKSEVDSEKSFIKEEDNLIIQHAENHLIPDTVFDLSQSGPRNQYELHLNEIKPEKFNTVKIHIGRVEIKAISSPGMGDRKIRKEKSPELTLKNFLKQREGK